MSNGKKVASIAFTGVAAVTAVGFHAGTALAASKTFHITPGGAYSGSNSTTATLTANGTTLNCAPGTATAHGTLLTTATGTSPTVGSIAAGAAFGTATQECSFLGGLVKFTAKTNKAINIVGKSVVGGVAKGHLGGTAGAISATITGTNCTANVSGKSIPFSYKSGKLNVNPGNSSTLTIKTVTGCSGLLAAGEKAGFHAIYAVSPVQTITSS
jgi:hypothetical protein